MRISLSSVNKILGLVGLRLISKRGWSRLMDTVSDRDHLAEEQRLAQIDLGVAKAVLQSRNGLTNNDLIRYFHDIDLSHSAFRQDLIALLFNNFKERGTFIEVGACDGIATSNTLLLERKYSWKGLLVEPASIWHPDLYKNRKVKIDTRCAWKTDGDLIEFVEKKSPGRSGILETSDDATESNDIYLVESVTLESLIAENFQSDSVDFLSVDTEGSELEVLQGFPFEKIQPSFICVEHNYNEIKRNQVRTFLAEHGYRVFLESLSYVDDWFYKN